VVKIRWVDGQPLNVHVRECAGQPQAVLHLADLWLGLTWQLRRFGVTHNNLDHDHVLVTRGPTGTLALQLIDYDGVTVPALAGQAPEKAGHPNYQHPGRLWEKCGDADGDRFPQLVVYTALRALAAGGTALWEAFDRGDNLLFRDRDFEKPATSPVFRRLWQLNDPIVHSLMGRLLLACQGSSTNLPLLEEVAGGTPLAPADEQQIAALFAAHPEPSPEPAPAPAVEAPPANEPEPASATVATVAEDVITDVEVVEEPCTAAGALATAVCDRTAGPLPKLPAPSVALADEAEETPKDRPGTNVYNLQAWMPEKIAVLKLQGFVRAEDGEIIESMPGLVRVQLLDRHYLPPDTPPPNLLSWLGLAQPPRPQTRVLAELTMQLKYKETDFQKLLDITVRIRPGPDGEPFSPRWRAYSDRMFCSLRSYLMGNNG
jgi:hypothetical protein